MKKLFLSLNWKLRFNFYRDNLEDLHCQLSKNISDFFMFIPPNHNHPNVLLRCHNDLFVKEIFIRRKTYGFLDLFNFFMKIIGLTTSFVAKDFDLPMSSLLLINVSSYKIFLLIMKLLFRCFIKKIFNEKQIICKFGWLIGDFGNED